ncbi:hypothetical protein D3C87_1929640 [compost metagenome]
MHLSIPEPQRVGGAEFLAQLIRPIRQATGELLVRDGDVAAAEAGCSVLETFDESDKIFRPYLMRAVASGQTEFIQPITVDDR